MADFKTQIANLTQISIGTIPTNDDISQWLVDGIKEVASRIIKINPALARSFSKTIELDGSPATVKVHSGIVLNVWRENGTASQLETCQEINAAERFRATDPESLAYRSKFNPAYYWSLNDINVIPTPSSSGDLAHVEYVGYDEAVGHSSTAISDFPEQFEYLVVLYGALKTINAKMASIDTPVDLNPPVIEEITYTAPTVPSITTVTYNDAEPTDLDIVGNSTQTDVTGISTAPAYNNNSVVGFSGVFRVLSSFAGVDDLAITAVPPSTPVAPDISSTTIDATLIDGITEVVENTAASFTTPPDYNTPFVEEESGMTESITNIRNNDHGSSNLGVQQHFDNYHNYFNVLGELIEVEEDAELAGAQLSKIQMYLEAFSKGMEDKLNIFNEENVVYQADIQNQLAILESNTNRFNKNADIAADRLKQNSDTANTVSMQNEQNRIQTILQDYQQVIAKYQADLSVYQQEVNKEVAEHQANTNYRLQAYSAEIQASLTQQSQLMQDSLNLFNEELAEYRATIEVGIVNANKVNEISLANMQKELQFAVQKQNKKQERLLETAVKNMEAIINDNTFAVQKYERELVNANQDMQRSVATNASTTADFQNLIQDYSARLQNIQVTYAWYQDQYTRIKAEYDNAFIALASAPKAAPQEAPRQRRRGRR